MSINSLQTFFRKTNAVKNVLIHWDHKYYSEYRNFCCYIMPFNRIVFVMFITSHNLLRLIFLTQTYWNIQLNKFFYFSQKSTNISPSWQWAMSVSTTLDKTSMKLFVFGWKCSYILSKILNNILGIYTYIYPVTYVSFSSSMFSKFWGSFLKSSF